ncbi:MAG: V-type ATP synthase subunit E [Planctomycetes bacterium]|nr:V-type ATP synthase subunit E [Planctomycetota bacterium]
MNAEQVVQKILSEAQAQADKITAEANAKVSEQQGQVDKELAKYREETEEKAVAAGEDKLARMLASARMQIGKEYLGAKVSLLDEVFQKVRHQIKNLPDDQYEELIQQLMEKAIESGDEEVIIGADETRIDNGLIKRINRKLGPGFKGNLQLANDTANIDGGFILRRGKIQVNVSLDVLMTQAREAMELQLSQELFG